VADRLVPVRRTEARTEAGSACAVRGPEGAGANGRSLLVRVPFAERVVGEDPAVRAAVVAPESAAAAPAAAPAAVGAGRGAFLPVDRPAGDVPAEDVAAEDVGFARLGPAGVELDRVDGAFVLPALLEADVRFGAGAGSPVDFSALMDQRYAVCPAARESNPGPAALPQPRSGPLA
jgi:hypothetical protein